MAALTAIYALTQQGAILAGKIAASMEVDLYVPPSLDGVTLTGKSASRAPKTYGSLTGLVAKTFRAYRNHVFMAAAGVAVRAIAPHLHNKSIDPAVVVLDHKGKYAVSLLSGHLESANELARAVAALTGARAVITSARETESLPSIDILALEMGLGIRNYKAAAAVKQALISGATVLVDDPNNHLRLRHSAWKDLFDFSGGKKARGPQGGKVVPPLRITVTPFLAQPSDSNLVLHPRVLHVGLDCRLGVRPEEILRLLTASLEQLGLAREAVASLASTDNRQFERGILLAAERLEVPARFFPLKECAAISPPGAAPGGSPKQVEDPETFADRSALLAAGPNAVLRVPKITERGVTIAVAEETPEGQ